MTLDTFKSTVAVSVLAFSVALSGCGGSDNVRPASGGETTGPVAFTAGGETTGPVAFTAGVDRLFPSQRTERLTDDGTSVVTRTANGWNLTVGGHSVTYTDSDHLGTNPQAPADFYTKRIGNEEIWFWSVEEGGFEGSPAPEFDYLDIYGFSHSDIVPGADLATTEPDDYTRGDYIYVVHGTPTSDMPITGTARYDGRVEAREWPSDAAGFARATSTVYEGDFAMTATFGGSGAEVTGTFSFPSVPGGIIPFATSANGNQLSISGLSIDAGPFAGYENIGVRAAFYGPAAAEVGGVFEGDNPTANKQMHGYFGGTKQ
jgi:hypothetical protein